MKVFFFAAVLVFSLTSLMAKPGWSENYAMSLAKAKAENKLLIVNFTGSDWCPACVVMDQEVFSTPEFKAYAKENLVLMEVDFPRKTSQLDAVRMQNRALQEKYRIQGFPTNLVLSPDGGLIAQFNLIDGGPKGLIDALKKLQPAPIANNTHGGEKGANPVSRSEIF